MVVPDLDLMALQLRETVEMPDRIEGVVEYCDFHVLLSLREW